MINAAAFLVVFASKVGISALAVAGAVAVGSLVVGVIVALSSALVKSIVPASKIFIGSAASVAFEIVPTVFEETFQLFDFCFVRVESFVAFSSAFAFLDFIVYQRMPMNPIGYFAFLIFTYVILSAVLCGIVATASVVAPQLLLGLTTAATSASETAARSVSAFDQLVRAAESRSWTVLEFQLVTVPSHALRWASAASNLAADALRVTYHRYVSFALAFLLLTVPLLAFQVASESLQLVLVKISSSLLALKRTAVSICLLLLQVGAALLKQVRSSVAAKAEPEVFVAIDSIDPSKYLPVPEESSVSDSDSDQEGDDEDSDEGDEEPETTIHTTDNLKSPLDDATDDEPTIHNLEPAILELTESFARLSLAASRGRRVNFGNVQVREYSATLGNNPDCPGGFPLSLDWAHTEVKEYDLEWYEETKPEAECAFLSTEERKQRIEDVAGMDRSALERDEEQRLLELLEEQQNIADDEDEDDEDEYGDSETGSDDGDSGADSDYDGSDGEGSNGDEDDEDDESCSSSDSEATASEESPDSAPDRKKLLQLVAEMEQQQQKQPRSEERSAARALQPIRRSTRLASKDKAPRLPDRRSARLAAKARPSYKV